jgi:hypothetical protein
VLDVGGVEEPAAGVDLLEQPDRDVVVRLFEAADLPVGRTPCRPALAGRGMAMGCLNSAFSEQSRPAWPVVLESSLVGRDFAGCFPAKCRRRLEGMYGPLPLAGPWYDRASIEKLAGEW